MSSHIRTIGKVIFTHLFSKKRDRGGKETVEAHAARWARGFQALLHINIFPVVSSYECCRKSSPTNSGTRKILWLQENTTYACLIKQANKLKVNLGIKTKKLTSIFCSCSTVWLATLMPLISRISSPTWSVPKEMMQLQTWNDVCNIYNNVQRQQYK